MEEDWHDDKAREWDVYVQGDVDSTVLQGWFTQVGEFGFGRDSSLGRGRFSVQVESADSRLFQHTGNRL
jgi:hypothetical protein